MLHVSDRRGAGGGLLGSVSASVGAGGISHRRRRGGRGQARRAASQVPTVLFVWGPGRILPVSVTSLIITEKLYDAVLLNPTHAEAQVGLQVLTPEELHSVDGPLAEIAKVAYAYSQGLRQALARRQSRQLGRVDHRHVAASERGRRCSFPAAATRSADLHGDAGRTAAAITAVRLPLPITAPAHRLSPAARGSAARPDRRAAISSDADQPSGGCATPTTPLRPTRSPRTN